MKKLLLIGSVVLLLVATACKKECTCVSYENGVEVMRVTAEVRGSCVDLNTKVTSGGIVMETKCN